MNKVRIDKWLWAARFFKTRALAKKAIEGGKVHCDGQRIKCSKEIVPGTLLQVRQGWDERVVEVVALSDRRGGASDAAKLYTETAQSIEKREREALQRKALKGTELSPGYKPDKRSRRQIQKTKELLLGE
ncbi:MAG: RNA-binding S4 domain-containing protein [Pseudomonadales bacterium]